MYRSDKKYEEYAYILDYLPHGRPGAPRSGQSHAGILQMVGESYFTLLEASPKGGSNYNIGDRIFVGKGERNRVSHILGRIRYDELSSSSKAELPAVIENIVSNNEEEFVEFFNKSQPVTPRMHSLELIPGIGKRLMFQILDQREKVEFQSFEDIQSRVNIGNPVKILSKRILEELQGDEKYNLFVRSG
ncbi:MAG: DUF655 domain-containing protein [Candidatus Bathyarchaeia archaeon]